MADEDRKIFIDEGWKAQVEREREEARKKLEAEAAQPDQAEQPAGIEPGQPEAADQEELLDEVSFMSLVGSLATQAMLVLGVIVPQGQKQVAVDLHQGKYLIDTLMMLRQKTKGNLTPEENSELTQAVGELQQIYVARAQQLQEHELRQAGVDPKNLKGKK